jgi:hypothetical protein
MRKVMLGVRMALWFGVLAAASVGVFEFGSLVAGTLSAAMDAEAKGPSAPQQAAVAAMALCWAVLPYVAVRAIDEALRPWLRPDQGF